MNKLALLVAGLFLTVAPCASANESPFELLERCMSWAHEDSLYCTSFMSGSVHALLETDAITCEKSMTPEGVRAAYVRAMSQEPKALKGPVTAAIMYALVASKMCQIAPGFLDKPPVKG